MAVTEKQTQFLTDGEIAAILTAKRALDAIRERAQRAEVPQTTWPAGRDHDLRNVGRLMEAADVAEDTLFNVLNTAASRLDDKGANAGCKRWNGE